MALTEMISVVFSKEQLRAIEKEAAKEGRKVGNYVRFQMVKHLKSIGALPEEDAAESDE